MGNSGGNIQLLGEQVGLACNAIIDASGSSGGGQILIGGDYQGQGDVQTARATYVGDEVQIKADAISNGDGGRVIVWANESTRMYGSISATGGAIFGDGGFVETSGGFLDIGSSVPDVGAVNGAGGIWLIDPHDITIVTGTGFSGFLGTDPFISTGNTAQLGVDLIASVLNNGGDVLVQTSDTAGTQAGNITWNAGVTLDLDDVNQSLTLSAHNDVNILGQINFITSVYSTVVALNNELVSTGVLNLDPIPELSSLYDSFLAEYIEPIIAENEDGKFQLICR